MCVRRSLIALLVALFGAACHTGDRAPLGPDGPLTQGPHFLRWAGDAAPQFSAIGAGTSAAGPVAPTGGAIRASLLSLDTYTATFWAVRGQERSAQINYQSGSAATQPFLWVSVSDPTYVPGVGEVAVGDSVLISITVDPESLKVTLEPTGAVFGTPTQLEMWYGGAGGDLNGDGVVDSTDAYVESLLLGIWYREGALDRWREIPAVQSVTDKSFTSALQHFCEFAVSW